MPNPSHIYTLGTGEHDALYTTEEKEQWLEVLLDWLDGSDAVPHPVWGGADRVNEGSDNDDALWTLRVGTDEPMSDLAQREMVAFHAAVVLAQTMTDATFSRGDWATGLSNVGRINGDGLDEAIRLMLTDERIIDVVRALTVDA